MDSWAESGPISPSCGGGGVPHAARVVSFRALFAREARADPLRDGGPGLQDDPAVGQHPRDQLVADADAGRLPDRDRDDEAALLAHGDPNRVGGTRRKGCHRSVRRIAAGGVSSGSGAIY
ncbi:hypothetical protein GCM10009682_30070 [Luedemannella flava]|uniref:Uncharacterized protein n=1 Tax=Luedemannella flava TaxID=349316 RepID=A0ABN2M197_9ACTN